MKTSKNYLALDFGASNARVAAGRYDGNKLQLDILHRFDNSPVRVAGKTYWDILYLFSNALKGIKIAAGKYKDIKSMALDSWALDFGLLDKFGNLISNPVSYRDEEKNIDSRQDYFKKVSKEKIFEITGYNPIYPSPALFYLYKMKLNQSPALKIAAKFLMVPDILNYFFTGRSVSEYTIASNTMMLNWKLKKWDKSILDSLEVDQEIFPEIIMTGKKIGKINKTIAEEAGLKKIPVIACALHDTASSIVGIPVSLNNKNWAVIGTGTWCIIGIETDSPVMDLKILDYPIINEGMAEGRNLLAKNLTGFWILQKCREKWSSDFGKNLDWDTILNLSLESKPFRSFIDIDYYKFAQNHSDMPKIIRDYCKKTNQPIPKDIGETARCIYESIIMRFKYDLSILENIYGRKVDVVHLIGGGIRNQPLSQWTADATVKKVVSGPVETSIIGNILMQMKADGEINSIEEGRKVSGNSTEIQFFEPSESDRWGESFIKYIDIVENN